MIKEKSFFRTVCALAVPVALQSMLQASFSIIDQIMIGQLGSVSVAGVGLAGKFSSVFSVLVSAVGAVAGIMIAQYLGQKNKREVSRSFFINLALALGFAGIFTVLCLALPRQIMGLYTQDAETVAAAADYLSVISGTFIPLAGATLLSAFYRCIENTGLNYILIFGKLGFAPMGAQGAAIATVISQAVNVLIMLLLMIKYKDSLKKGNRQEHTPFNLRQYAVMLMPVLVCEFLWSLGENVYSVIYGHLGTEACAAMTLINPIQGLMIGALCGLSQAAGVIIGKRLGEKNFDSAYSASKRLILYGFIGSAVLSVLIALTSALYVELYQVEDTVKLLTRQILLAYAIIAPFKVLNMIVSGGIIRSGGKTKYVMMIDLIGTWCFGVPLGLLAAFVFNLSIPYVYFILSLEECIRFGISIIVLRRKKWMQSLEA